MTALRNSWTVGWNSECEWGAREEGNFYPFFADLLLFFVQLFILKPLHSAHSLSFLSSNSNSFEASSSWSLVGD